MRYLLLLISLFAVPAAFAMAQAEPDMKVTEGSGGKAVSSLITGAPLRDDFVMGNRKAPIVLVEYASMTCPHCAHFSNTVLPVLEEKYIKAGKLAYILRQFPLNEPALDAAELLDCVGTQDEKKYFVFARVLFDAQSKWAFDSNYVTGLETIANVGGLTKSQFQNCINNTERELKILKAKKLANDEVQVPHTPYIFIDGEAYEGERTPEEVSKFIDAKLAKKGK